MRVEEAINTATIHEVRVCDLYREATDKATSEDGKRVFHALEVEEQGHVDYLQHKAEELKTTGKVTASTLATVVPAAEVIENHIKKLAGGLIREDHGVEIEMLQRALALETETLSFYRQLVSRLQASDQLIFKRFVEIEEGHVRIVQAELDMVGNKGFWFDFQEFDLSSQV